MEDEIEAGDDVDDSEQKLPQDAAGGVGFEGEDEVEDSAEEHGPADEDGDADAGDEGNEESE